MELLDYVNDYQENFVGKKCQVQTNYKQLEYFIVAFSLTDLHHLFGFHKVLTEYANKTISAILAGDLVLSDLSSHPNFKQVKDRIALYPFIGQIFCQREVKICIVNKDLSPNTMNLDIVFLDEGSRFVSVLGLRRSKEGEFRLVTLHQAPSKKYKRMKKTLIKDILWL